MGKTPGKWIKSLLSGKKSSKSNLSKKNDIFKPSSNNDVFVSSDVSVTAPTVNSSLITVPISGANPTKETSTDIVSGSSNDHVTLPAGDEEANVPAVVISSQDDIEKIKLNEAAIKAQSALRGYLARRTFRMLKGFTQLQALIRAQLVRRQAVSTLYCVKGIVKFQALARGHKVRRSEIGLAVHTICKGTKYSNSVKVVTPTQVEKLSESVFVHKLLALASSSVPVHLSYDPGEPNLAWEWLDRWTRSHFWAPLPESKKKLDLVSDEKEGSSEAVEKDEVQTKRNSRRVSKAKVENGSVSDSSKNKRHPKKVSSNTLQSSHESSHKEIEKNNSKRTSTHNVSDRLEVSSEKRKHITRKVSGHTISNVEEQDPSASAEKVKDMAGPKSKKPDIEKSLGKQVENEKENELNDDPMANLQTTLNNSKDMAGSKSKKPDIEKSLGKQVENEKDNELNDNPMANLQTTLNNSTDDGIQGISEDLNSGDNSVGNVNPKSSLRRASLPGKFDDQDNGIHSSPRLPSYMAPTESAKAKLRAQGSPRFASDLIDKNGIFRRHSLSSSMNGKLDSYSPRAERLIAMSSRGVIRTDRSLSSLRDGTDRIVQPLWRR